MTLYIILKYVSPCGISKITDVWHNCINWGGGGGGGEGGEMEALIRSTFGSIFLVNLLKDI